MNTNSKLERLKERIESHLRRTARHLVKFDTVEETLNYLINSFWMEFACDFVGIILKDNDVLIPKVWKGGTEQFEQAFPIQLNQCSPNLLEVGWSIEKVEEGFHCEFQKVMKQENITTWFTIPLKDDGVSLGFCIIGFHHFVPLIYETERIFIEFGKDVAVVMTAAQNKEADKKKMSGLEWINEIIFPGSSIELLVEKIVERACKGTQAEAACIYLYDEAQNSFFFQPPSVGLRLMPDQIKLGKNDKLKEYFPFLEKLFDNEITVPLVVNLKIIGVLHVANKLRGTFTQEDLEVLEFLSSHVSALLENARLYRIEIDLKQRLQTFMGYHQELVKQTVEGQNFEGISLTLSNLFFRSVVLFDRFLRPISYHLREQDEHFLQTVMIEIQHKKEHIHQIQKTGIWLGISNPDDPDLGIWPVIGGGDLLGYLAVHIRMEDLDDVLRLTIDHAINVYSIQFIKQKLVMDTKEQVKDSFINKLLVENIVDRDNIIEYANLFHWNLFQAHRIGILTIQMENGKNEDSDLLDREARKSWVWEQFRERLSILDPDIILTRRGDEFVVIVPASKEVKGAKEYWRAIYDSFQKIIQSESPLSKVYLGVGSKTEKLEDYYASYKQAIQAHNVVSHRFREDGFALFDDLGAYTLLHNLNDPSVAILFIKKYLAPLLDHSEGKGADLFHTLRMFLFKNANWKATTDGLYIHRSTLKYRLEKIQSLLGLDLDDAEHCFNLMIAYKLYDMYYESK